MHQKQDAFAPAILETVAEAEPATQPPLARTKVRGGRRRQESLLRLSSTVSSFVTILIALRTTVVRFAVSLLLQPTATASTLTATTSRRHHCSYCKRAATATAFTTTAATTTAGTTMTLTAALAGTTQSEHLVLCTAPDNPTAKIHYLAFVFGPKPGDLCRTSALLSKTLELPQAPTPPNSLNLPRRFSVFFWRTSHACSKTHPGDDGFGRQTRQEQNPAWGFRVECCRRQISRPFSFSCSYGCHDFRCLLSLLCF